MKEAAKIKPLTAEPNVPTVIEILSKSPIFDGIVEPETNAIIGRKQEQDSYDIFEDDEINESIVAKPKVKKLKIYSM